MSLSSAALRRPITTIAVTLGLILFGLVSLGQLPVTLLPNIDLPVLTIRTAAPEFSSTEVSRFVAEPIEAAVGATPGLVEMRSVSRAGEGTTTLRFTWGTDMPRTLLSVRENLDRIRGSLPNRPNLLTTDPGQRPIAMLALTTTGELRAIARTARDVHSRQLEQLPGIASVVVVGDPGDEIRVDVDPERTRALGVTVDEIRAAIDNGNVQSTSGTILRGQYRYQVRPLTELRDPSEIADLPIRPNGGTPIRLGDLARITPASANPTTLVRLDGQPAVGLVVYKDAGANTVEVTRLIDTTLATLQGRFPEIATRVVTSQASFVEDALTNLSQEILIGGALSILLILLCLRDWRMSVAIGIMVPLSIFVSLTLLQLFDVTINILSLGGLALAVGMLVDNAIVVAEATERIRGEGATPWEAARQAAEEIAGPLIAGTLTTALVFGPIVFVRGLAAALFRDLSLAVVVTLMASLVLALTLMPILTTWGRRRHQVVVAQRRDGPLERIGRWLAHGYEVGMRWSLHHPVAVITMAVGLTAVTGVLLTRLPREILPQVDEGTITIALHLPPGTSIEETTRQTARIEAEAERLGSSGIYARVGAATDEEILIGADPGSASTAMLVVPVPDHIPSARFAAQLRSGLPDLAGMLSTDQAGQSEFGSLVGRTGRLVQVEVSAQTTELAQEAAGQVRRALDSLPELSEVQNAFRETQAMIEIAIRRDRLARHNIAPNRVASAMQGALGGVAARDLQDTDHHTPIRIRYAGAASENLEVALQTTINRIPVADLVTVHELQVPIAVVRVNQRPVTIVEAVAEEGGISAATTATVDRLESLALPRGVTWHVSGADEEQRRTSRELTLVAFLSVALMFLVLAGEFGSFTTPLIVMTTVPLAGAGGIILLWLMGQSINAVSLIGIIVMIGLADNEAVVKLDAIQRFRAKGHTVDDAIVLGGHQRLRAIAMTALTTITGVLPLVFNLGAGGELYQPLAAGVIGGSVTALLVTFFLLPTVYALVERWKDARAERTAA